MATVVRELNSKTKKTRPALTAEGREKQLISLAVDCAEEQLKNGTASSQLIVHYLRLGSEKTRLEMEKLKEENKLLVAKTEAIKSLKSQEELYANAIRAMRRYSGEQVDDEPEDI